MNKFSRRNANTPVDSTPDQNRRGALRAIALPLVHADMWEAKGRTDRAEARKIESKQARQSAIDCFRFHFSDSEIEAAKVSELARITREEEERNRE